MPLPPIILASVSPRRKELLGTLDYTFTVIGSDAPEAEDEQLTGLELCQLNAFRKARVITRKHPEALVIGADTMVYLGTRLFGKPATLAEASEMLLSLQGKTHQVATGVCLWHKSARRQRLFADVTDVTFRELNQDQINAYLSAMNPLDKAGGYAIQDRGEQIISTISGSYSNVVGLPMEMLKTELEAWQKVPGKAPGKA